MSDFNEIFRCFLKNSLKYENFWNKIRVFLDAENVQFPKNINFR